MTQRSETASQQQTKSWKAIQMQVQALAKKAQQVRVDKSAKSK